MSGHTTIVQVLLGAYLAEAHHGGLHAATPALKLGWDEGAEHGAANDDVQQDSADDKHCSTPPVFSNQEICQWCKEECAYTRSSYGYT